MQGKWHNIFVYLSGIIVMGYLLFAVVLSYKPHPSQSCDNIRIILKDSVERQFISSMEIVSLLKQKGVYPVGKELCNVSCSAIEEVLQAHPVIQSSECYKTSSGLIKIKVRQRVPKFRVITENESYYVDTHREVMPVLSGCAAYVPVVTGRVGKSFAKDVLFDFVDYLENDELWKDQITQIHVTEYQEIVLSPRVGSHRVELGKMENYESKMEKLRKLYVDGFSQLGWKSYRVIDLRYKGQAVCRY